MDDVSALLPHLPTLAAFAQVEQVTGAAEILGVPQPYVSRSITRAEQVTGLKLKVRTGREVRPTKDALVLGEAAQAALTGLNNALHEVRAQVYGVVRVAFQHSLGEYLVPQAISNFVTDHPHVEFSLMQGSRSECLHAVESGKADAAFVAIRPQSPVLSSQIIAQERLALAVPHDHELAGRDSVCATDFAHQDFISMRHGLGLRRTTDALLHTWNISPRTTFEGQEITTVLGLVAAGLGVSIVPDRAQHSGVCLVKLNHEEAVRDIAVSVARNRELPTASAQFVKTTYSFFAQN